MISTRKYEDEFLEFKYGQNWG